jgi:tetratricopeptide (TPR) repeat protein
MARHHTSKSVREGPGGRSRQPVPPPSPPPLAADPRLVRHLALLVALLAFGLYANSLRNGYTLDDLSAILENRYVRQGASAIPEILAHSYRHGSWNARDELYRPLSTVMFAIEWQFFPRKPLVNHLVGVGFYCLTGYFLLLLLHDLLEQQRVLVALVTSLLFVAHPLHTDVVSGIKGRDEIMSFFFAVLALYFLRLHLDSRRLLLLLPVAGAYFLSLLAKETGITLVAVVPVLIWFFRPVSPARNLIGVMPFGASAAAYLLIRSQVLAGGIAGAEQFALLENVVAHAPDTASRLSTALYILGWYLKLLAVPHPLVCDYSYAAVDIVPWSNVRVWFAVAAYGAIGACIVWNVRGKRILAFALLYYLLTVSIVSNLVVLIGAAMAERFLYAPSLGFALVLAVALVRAAGVSPDPAPPRIGDLVRANRRLFLYLSPFLALYAAHTLMRNQEWKDNYTLYSADVRKMPENARLHYFLGSAIVNEVAPAESDPVRRNEYLDQAIAELHKAIGIYEPYAHAHSQMGVAYYRKGDRQKAIDCYTRALQYGPDAAAYSNLGVCYCELGDVDQGIAMLRKAVDHDDQYVDALVNLGIAHGMRGDWQQAIAWYQRVVELLPGDPLGYESLADAHIKSGDLAAGQRCLEKALELRASH